MITLDKNTDYLYPDRVKLTKIARTFIKSQISFICKELPKKDHVAVMSLGIEGPWIGFDERENIATEALPFISQDGILFTMPLRVDGNGVLHIDYSDGELKFQNVGLEKLIPSSLRAAFLTKLGQHKP